MIKYNNYCTHCGSSLSDNYSPKDWTSKVLSEFKKKTIFFNFKESDFDFDSMGIYGKDLNKYKRYKGPDYTVDNIIVKGNTVIIGSPEIEECYPDDSLASYNTVEITIKDGKITNVYSEFAGPNCVSFKVGNKDVFVDELCKNKVDLTSEDPKEFVNSLYQEIGL